MNEKEEVLWILAENVRHADSMQQTGAIDLLLAGYFKVTADVGEFSLHYSLPIWLSHILRCRSIRFITIRYPAREGHQVSQCRAISRGLKQPS